MDLTTFFQKYNLTSDQAKLVEKLDSFLLNENQFFILKGYAGTGKTFLMKGLSEYLTAIKRNFMIAAPTGRAAKIISEKTHQEAKTIHKMIYSETLMQVDENIGKIDSLKFRFELNLNIDSIDTVYIIDEASMVSNVRDESEFLSFGSGQLLKDLILYANFGTKLSNRKIIFIGDSAQLPPINMNYSPALSVEYLINNFGGKATAVELKEVVRHKTESGILKNATNIRNSISRNFKTELNISNSNDVIHLKTKDLLSNYISELDSNSFDKQVIIAHSNSSVKELNDLIRSHYFPGKKTISKNDLILLTKNNYNYSIDLFNGDFGRVYSVGLESETINVIFKRKTKYNDLKTYNIFLTFRNVCLTFQDSKKGFHQIYCKIIENLLYSKNGQLLPEEQMALFVDFIKRHPKLKAGTIEFKDELKIDPYFNALQIKFGYAVTCHKAQGGEWKKVFVDCNAKMGKSNSTYFRWLYTAITRAKDKLFVINPPIYRAGSNMRKTKIQITTEVSKSIVIDNDKEENNDSKFSFDNEFQRNLHFSILEQINELDVCIEDILHKQFCEHYLFSQNSQKTRILFYYNSKNRVTKLMPNEESDFSKSLLEKLKCILNREIEVNDKILSPIKSKLEFDFPIEFPFLKELYSNICSKFLMENIVISNIKHLQWRERYNFNKENLKAVVDFTYNKKGEFSFLPINHKSNSDELLEKIIQLLEKL